MKSIISAIVTAVLSALIISNLHAQELSPNAPEHKATFAPPADISSPVADPSPASAKSKKELKKEARAGKAFNRVTRRFEDRFTNATNVAWTPQSNGYTASFDSDGLRHRVWYNNQGEVTYLMITYGEQRLPFDVKRQVKRAYGDYNITCVNEIHQDDIVVHLVTLENSSTIKQITVCNGDINLYKQFKRAL